MNYALLPIAVLLFAMGDNMVAANTLPARTECIVGFDLDWSKVRTDALAIRNAMNVPPWDRWRVGPLAAIVISSDGSHMYLQYERDCEDRSELADKLILYWKERNPRLPEFRHIEGPIFRQSSL
jgi:hypothetical protein